jgi:hypothetical protein
MQTIREQQSTDQSPVRLTPSYTTDSDILNQSKTLKIREYKSWSVCFAIIVGLTGLMKWLNIGVTMDSVNSILLFFSLMGLIYFVSRIYLLSGKAPRPDSKKLHELN